MITGCVPFLGETPTETISLILQKESPPLTRYVPDVPAELERIVNKALTKNCEERYQSAKDLLIDLRNLKRKLEVDAEIDRTISPEFRAAHLTRSTSGGPNTPASTSSTAASPTADATHSTSSAQYIVSGIKQHKLAALVAALVLTVGVVAITYVRGWSAASSIDSVLSAAMIRSQYVC